MLVLYVMDFSSNQIGRPADKENLLTDSAFR